MSMSGCSKNGAALPLAVTMGEPAGIGGEIALKAWLARSATMPPFYLIDDPERLAALARALGWPVPVRPIAAPEEAGGVFATALPVQPLAITPRARPACPDPADAPAILASIESAVAAVRPGRGRRHEPDPQAEPLSRRFWLSRSYRIPGHARRHRRSAGHDACLRGAARSSDHDPSALASGGPAPVRCGDRPCRPGDGTGAAQGFRHRRTASGRGRS